MGEAGSVELGRLLTPVARPEPVEPAAQYRLVGAHWYAKGLYIKETKVGSGIRAKTLYRLRAGDFVYNRLFAWMGSFAVADAAVDGCYGSNEFLSYTINSECVEPEYLRYYFSRKGAWLEALGLSSGSTPTSRNRLKEEKFLGMTIPLPSRSVQRDIIDRLSAISSRLEEVDALVNSVDKTIFALVGAELNRAWRDRSGWSAESLGKLARTVSGQVDPRVEPYRGLPHINGEAIEAGTGRLLTYRTAEEDGVVSGKYHFSAGSILYSKIRPYLRKSTQVPVEGLCSADVYAFEWIDPRIAPRFLMYSLIAGPFANYANDLSGRTRMPKLNQDQLFKFDFQYPSLEEQLDIVERLDGLIDRIDRAKGELGYRRATVAALRGSVLNSAFSMRL